MRSRCLLVVFALMAALLPVGSAAAGGLAQAKGAGPEHPGVTWTATRDELQGLKPLDQIDVPRFVDPAVVVGEHLAVAVEDGDSGVPQLAVLNRRTGELVEHSTSPIEMACGLVAGPDGRVWYASPKASPDGSTTFTLVGVGAGQSRLRWTNDTGLDIGCHTLIRLQLSAGRLVLTSADRSIVQVDPTTATTANVVSMTSPDSTTCQHRSIRALRDELVGIVSCSDSAENRLVGRVDLNTGVVQTAVVDARTKLDADYTSVSLQLEHATEVAGGFAVPVYVSENRYEPPNETIRDAVDLVHVSLAGGSISQSWYLEGPESTQTRDENCVDGCVPENPATPICETGAAVPCSWITASATRDGTIVAAAPTGDAETGFYRVDVATGSATRLATVPFGHQERVIGLDADGWFWMAMSANGFQERANRPVLVAVNVDGRVGGDSDGDGVLEHGMGEFRLWDVMRRPFSEDDEDPSVSIYGFAPIADDGLIYAWAASTYYNQYGFTTNEIVFEVGEVAPGEALNDPSGASTQEPDGTDPDGSVEDDPGPDGTDPDGSVEDGQGNPWTSPSPQRCAFAGDRISGNGPVGTAVELSRARFDQGGALHAVLSRDDAFPDSLAASGLTGDGPLLFTPTGGLNWLVEAELTRLLAPGATVYLLGGTSALSPAVESAVADAGFTPVRLSGPDRVATSVAVAREILDRYGAPSHVALARAWGSPGSPSSGWADSVAAASWAAAGKVPIVLTPSEQLDSHVGQLLDEAGAGQHVLLGGRAALSDAVEAAVPASRRVSGPNRQATAVAISRELWNATGASDQCYLVINGFDEAGWTYGLAAGGYAASRQSPVLLTTAPAVPAETLDEAASQSVCVLAAVGPQSLVPDARLDDIRAVAGACQAPAGGGGGTGGGSTPGGSGASQTGALRIQDPLLPGVDLTMGDDVEVIHGAAQPAYPLRVEISGVPSSEVGGVTLTASLHRAAGAGTELVAQASWGAGQSGGAALRHESRDGQDLAVLVDTVDLGSALSEVPDVVVEVEATLADGTVVASQVDVVNLYALGLDATSALVESSSDGDFRFDADVSILASLDRVDATTLDREGDGIVIHRSADLALDGSPPISCSGSPFNALLSPLGGELHHSVTPAAVTFDYTVMRLATDITLDCDDGQQRSLPDPWWSTFSLAHQDEAADGFLRGAGWSAGDGAALFTRTTTGTDDEHGTTTDGHTWSLVTTWDVIKVLDPIVSGGGA